MRGRAYGILETKKSANIGFFIYRRDLLSDSSVPGDSFPGVRLFCNVGFILGNNDLGGTVGAGKGPVSYTHLAGKISDTRDTSAPEKRSVHDKAAGYVLLAVFLVLATGQIRGLADGKVLFLYEEDTESIAFAQEHKEKPVVYFYNPNLTWMIWDDSLAVSYTHLPGSTDGGGDDKKADVGCSVKICDDYIYNVAGAVYISVLPEVFCKGCHARLVKRVTV